MSSVIHADRLIARDDGDHYEFDELEMTWVVRPGLVPTVVDGRLHLNGVRESALRTSHGIAVVRDDNGVDGDGRLLWRITEFVLMTATPE